MCVKWKANTGQTLSQLVSVTDGYPLYIPEPTTHEPTTDAPPSQPLAWVSTPGMRIILSPEAQRWTKKMQRIVMKNATMEEAHAWVNQIHNFRPPTRSQTSDGCRAKGRPARGKLHRAKSLLRITAPVSPEQQITGSATHSARSRGRGGAKASTHLRHRRSVR